jgi:hypothetical protein
LRRVQGVRGFFLFLSVELKFSNKNAEQTTIKKHTQAFLEVADKSKEEQLAPLF